MFVDMLHRDLPEMLSSTEEKLWREEIISASVRDANLIQCISKTMADRVHAYYSIPADRTFVTYLALRDNVPWPGNPVVANASFSPYFLYPANIWPHKAHACLIEAFARFRQNCGTWDLLLTGFPATDPRVDGLRERAVQLGVGTRVTFAGHVSPGKFEAILRAAGALVFPSRYEGFGMPVFEALTFGVPVVASRIPVLVEVAAEAALYFSPGDPVELAACMKAVSSDVALHRNLREKGLARAATFSARTEIAKLAQALRRDSGR
jgi:glycosyltransferase involved in cell wall biosynthesis